MKGPIAGVAVIAAFVVGGATVEICGRSTPPSPPHVPTMTEVCKEKLVRSIEGMENQDMRELYALPPSLRALNVADSGAYLGEIVTALNDPSYRVSPLTATALSRFRDRGIPIPMLAANCQASAHELLGQITVDIGVLRRAPSSRQSAPQRSTPQKKGAPPTPGAI
jgi:hypothetical protein